MADVREALTQHLTAHGVPLEIGIRSTDLLEILNSMDYAMLLGYIEPRQAAMLLAKYCADAQEERKCRAWWLMDCIEYGAAKGWRRPQARMIEGMAYATMDEHMGHGIRCDLCNGTRQREFAKLLVKCPACDGLGFNLYDSSRFGAEIGCTPHDWQYTWSARVDWARRALHRWEADAVENLRRRFGS